MTQSAIWDALPLLLKGAAFTILISAISMAVAILIGMVAALISQASLAVPRAIVRAYVEIFRDTPLLIQILIFYFGLPQVGISFSPFACSILALSLYTAAYNVEIFRAGLEAVPKGQYEAARATGLSPIQEAIYVVIPQALKISLPALGNNLISLVKNSSLVSVIGMVELTFQANEISFKTFRSLEAYTMAGIMYVIIVLSLTRVLNRMEAKLFGERS